MLRTRPIALHAGIAVMVSALIAACWHAATDTHEGTGAAHARFDAGAWQRGDAAVRASMTQDLVGAGRLIGKTRAEVKALLGEPDQEGPGFLAYFVYFGADHTAGPAYVIDVEIGPRGDVVDDARIEADSSQGGSD